MLSGYGVADSDLVDALRVVCGAAPLRRGGERGQFGLPRDVGASYERYVATLDAGPRTWAAS